MTRDAGTNFSFAETAQQITERLRDLNPPQQQPTARAMLAPREIINIRPGEMLAAAHFNQNALELFHSVRSPSHSSGSSTHMTQGLCRLEEHLNEGGGSEGQRVIINRLRRLRDTIAHEESGHDLISAPPSKIEGGDKADSTPTERDRRRRERRQAEVDVLTALGEETGRTRAISEHLGDTVTLAMTLATIAFANRELSTADRDIFNNAQTSSYNSTKEGIANGTIRVNQTSSTSQSGAVSSRSAERAASLAVTPLAIPVLQELGIDISDGLDARETALVINDLAVERNLDRTKEARLAFEQRLAELVSRHGDNAEIAGLRGLIANLKGLEATLSTEASVV